MKYCSHCGAEINDEAVVCIKCGCSVSNTTNQNDAPNKGFAVLGFFFPIVGFILWLVWNNTSPKKAKSCGIGALIGVIGIPIIAGGIFALVMFVTTSSVLTYNIMNKGGKNQSVVSDTSSPYVGKSPIYSYYTDIGSITTKTRDTSETYSVTIVLNLGYDSDDIDTKTELDSKRYELRDFVRAYLTGKYAIDLAPENEERLKNDLKELLNTRFLTTGKIRIIVIDRLDVIETF